MNKAEAYFTAFQNNYQKIVSALPMNSIYPTLVSHGLMCDIALSSEISAAKSDCEKTRIFLNSMMPGIQIGVTETFDKFLEAMEKYAKTSKSEAVKVLWSSLKEDLPSGMGK